MGLIDCSAQACFSEEGCMGVAGSMPTRRWASEIFAGIRPGGSEAEGRHPDRLPRPCPEGCQAAVTWDGRAQAEEGAALMRSA